MSKISCIIMDWAGTAVDYGCFAPVHAFVSMFSDQGIKVSIEQTRAPMGLPKIDHIRKILANKEVTDQFQAIYDRSWNNEDVALMNATFEGYLFATLEDFTTPIPHVIETLDILRAKGIRIGSTTGYTDKMMEVVRQGAAQKGYVVDNLVTPNSVPAGRPAPYMVYQNMIDLQIDSPRKVVKVGDTIADIREGVNAGVWTVGILEGSNDMGLTQQEFESMDQQQLIDTKNRVRKQMLDNGADYVLDNISSLPACIDQIESL